MQLEKFSEEELKEMNKVVELYESFCECKHWYGYHTFGQCDYMKCECKEFKQKEI